MTHIEETYHKIVDFIKSLDCFKLAKECTEGDFIYLSFQNKKDKTDLKIEIIKDYVSENGYKNATDFATEKGMRYYQICYYNIGYDKLKDKLSYKKFYSGYGINKHCNIYPFAKNWPIITITPRQVYSFIKIHHNMLIRVYTKCYNSFEASGFKGAEFTLLDRLEQIILNIYEKRDIYSGRRLPVSSKHYQNGVKDNEVIDNLLGYKVSKTFSRFQFSTDDYYHIVNIIKRMKNKNDFRNVINTLAKVPVMPEYIDFKYVLFTTMGFTNYSTYNYTFSDWLREIYYLKLPFNIKIRSWKRIEEEHRRNSSLIGLKGIPKELKPDTCFLKLFEGFDQYPVEIIDTKERIIKESVINDHCVGRNNYYAQNIINGNIGIYSVLYADQRFTLTVNRYFQIQQFKGYRNCEVPISLRFVLEDYLKAKISHLKVKYQIVTNEAENFDNVGF
jgi:hypothetical protein